MNTRNKQSDIYNNWQMLSPSGKLLARCSKKRADWYLNRGIATLVSEKTIALEFEPAGLGNTGVPFLLEDKENICVVCGTEHDLNRHHVVPYQYRKWMSTDDKSYASYDVLPICLDHHDEYEEYAQRYSKELAIMYDAPFSVGKLSPEDNNTQKIFALLKVVYKHPVPEPRKSEIKQLINDYFGHEVTEEESLKLLAVGPRPYLSELAGKCLDKSHSQLVIEHVMSNDKLQEFIVNWRQHFVDTMKPQFLSKNWDIFHVHRAHREI